MDCFAALAMTAGGPADNQYAFSFFISSENGVFKRM
jgi:hypothetical protein